MKENSRTHKFVYSHISGLFDILEHDAEPEGH